MSKVHSSTNSILVIGDVMLDKYWHSSSSTLSEEAFAAAVVVDSTDYRAGGAANVALNIKMLAKSTTDVTVLAPLGQDDNGSILKNIINKANINACWQYNSITTTITKHRILNNNQQVVRVDFEKRYEPISLNETVKQIISEHKVIVLSDYNKGTLDLVSEIINYARSLHKIILVDPKGHDFNKYKGATLLTPNYKEYTDIVGFEDLDGKAYKLIEQLGLDNLLVTLGAAGMTLYNKDLSSYHACSYAEQVYDVTGAGDTVIASLAVSLAEDTDKIKSIEYASYAAALVVSQIGTGYATRPAVKQLMAQCEFRQAKQLRQNDKVFSITSRHDLASLTDLLNSKQNLNKVIIYYWDYQKDNILNADNIAKLITVHNQNQLQQLWIVISNNLNLAKFNPTHNIEDLAYCLGQLATTDKIIYSDSIELKSHIEHFQSSLKLEQEYL
jgi:rfaE bifunctional protein kinase chain/domain